MSVTASKNSSGQGSESSASAVRSSTLAWVLESFSRATSRIRGGEVGSEELRRSGFGECLQEAPGGAANVEDAKRIKVGSQQIDERPIPEWNLADAQPDARVVTRGHPEVVTPVATRFVSIVLAKNGSFTHEHASPLALPNAEWTGHSYPLIAGTDKHLYCRSAEAQWR